MTMHNNVDYICNHSHSLYPELKKANVAIKTIRIASTPNVVQWYSTKSFDQDRLNINVEEVEGVQVTMPREDWEKIMEIYQSHYVAINQNPGVLDRWMEYRMMVALTEK